MSLKYIAQILLVCMTSGIIFIVIASASFVYYVEKFRPDSAIIEAFLRRLRFPANRTISFLPTGRVETAAKELESESHDYVWHIRIVCAGILVVNLVFWIWMVFRQTHWVDAIGNAIILIYMITASHLSWRFGHKLKLGK